VPTSKGREGEEGRKKGRRGEGKLVGPITIYAVRKNGGTFVVNKYNGIV